MATRQRQAALVGLVLTGAWACSDPTSSPPPKEADAGLAIAEESAGVLAFSVSDLGTAAGLLNSIGEGINFPGEVAGVSYGGDPVVDLPMAARERIPRLAPGGLPQ